MEIKRATELSICALLKEQLPDLNFYASKGGGDDVTPTWLPNHFYQVGDVLRPSDLSLVQAISIIRAGTSGATEPVFTDVPGSLITGPPDYLTTSVLSVSTEQDAINVIPPFAAVLCEPAEKMIGYEDTNIMHGSVLWVSRHDSTNVVTHSDNAKRIYDALKSITSGYDILRRITLHGLDISATDDFTDTEKEAHGDVIEFTVGVSANPR